MAGPLKAFDYEVFGRVQGVFFRKFTKNKADELGLVGWVMNTVQGTVVGQVEGQEKNADKLKEWLCKTGSPKSHIERCDIKNEKSIEKTSFSNFDASGNGEAGLSYNSIFTYSNPSSSTAASSSSARRNGGFSEYWRPTDYSLLSDCDPISDASMLKSFIRLFLHPPFATSNDSSNRPGDDWAAAMRNNDSVGGLINLSSMIGQQLVWTVMFFLFGTIWLVLLPFHWYWTIRRVGANEAFVIFRVGQSPMVFTKTGTVVCIWPFIDRTHRVSLSRRGFSVPPSQIGLDDGSVVRLGADVSFHVIDPLRYVRMSNDTASSIRHVVQGQFVSFIGKQSLTNLQRFSSGVQSELRMVSCRHLSQFGVVVDTFVISQLSVIRQPSDPGKELIDTLLQAIKSGGGGSPINAIGSLLSSSSVVMPPPMSLGDASNDTTAAENGNVEKVDNDETAALKLTNYLKESVKQLVQDAQDALSLTPDSVFRLEIGDSHAWLIYPYTGQVEGPLNPSSLAGGNKEQGRLSLSSWNTLEQLRNGSISPTAAAMSGLLSFSGDAIALAKLFDPSKL